MLTKLITAVLLMSWISSKILVLQDSDLPKLMKMFSKDKKLSRKLEAADSGTDDADLENASTQNVDENQKSEGDEEKEKEEDEEPVEHTPLICEYKTESRPGFVNKKDSNVMMLPGDIGPCEVVAEYEVSHKIDWKEKMEDEDLEGCKGIEYTYPTEDGDLTTTLYPVQSKDPNNELKFVDAGYYSSLTNTTKIYRDGMIYKYRKWMNDIVLLCMKK